jgi:hypothetical protein
LDLDLFTVVSEGSKPVAEIAGRCRASDRGIRILCDYLTKAGSFSKTGVMYEPTPTSAVFLWSWLFGIAVAPKAPQAEIVAQDWDNETLAKPV